MKTENVMMRNTIDIKNSKFSYSKLWVSETDYNILLEKYTELIEKMKKIRAITDIVQYDY